MADGDHRSDQLTDVEGILTTLIQQPEIRGCRYKPNSAHRREWLLGLLSSKLHVRNGGYQSDAFRNGVRAAGGAAERNRP
ncbi:MAG: hypothetical protein F8N36_14395 [Desulfovibrio sp.]|uniref:hypothetical protein n=1 Tax=Desulfovibrio sp. TaxID=885 RepID=UPI00135E150C|nr:hypothetical protein [Desulfovibrio sp.]MTJ94028.1 hypothetical protein [Desulfovibrio sp.]